ncbi:MAG: DNA translocase FtsK [Cytophagales bacterium]|nr:DNA translocase FtsK [Cytophagales bacterium]
MAKNTYKKKSKKSGEKQSLNVDFLKDRKLHLAIGWFLLLTSFFLTVSFISYLKTGKADQSVVDGLATNGLEASGAEVQNWFGVAGAYVGHYFIFIWFGIAALLIPPMLFIVGVRINWFKALLPLGRSFTFAIFYLLWFSTLLGYFQLGNAGMNTWSFLSGGLGYELAILLNGFMGWATVLFLAFLFLVFNMYLFDITHLDFVQKSIKKIKGSITTLFSFKKKVSSADDLNAVLEQVKKEVEEEEQTTEVQLETDKTPAEEWIVENNSESEKEETEELKLNIEISTPDEVSENTLEVKEQSTKDPESISEIIDGMEVKRNEIDEKHTEEQSVNFDPTLELPNYKFPTPSLLIEYPPKDVQVSKDELEQNKNKIVETLINFKIGIQSIKATIGPTVTLYEIVPKAGVKISKIKNLEDDIALSLAALGIRIIAPIPGRGTIGIEVPNKNREMVDVRSVITTEKFMKSEFDLPVVLGKTISNEVFVTDLAKMPHLLMAGATGQGKSVGLNMVITSLLYKKHPSQLKFVLVDPKKVELTLFNKIEKHFLAKLPDAEDAIITDTSIVVNTLNSLCIEMDNRYDLLKNAGCRNLKEYNKKFENRRLNPNKGHKYLPYIVLVIDELADLMMTAGKEVEAPIARLAQLARAIGIHLLVATQRPSVNVITGIIKANFPARLSFRVTSKIDSRTILDTGGADQLIGMGDMLLSLGSEMIRLQCAFVDTPEVDHICDFIGDQKGYESAYMLPEYVGEESSGIGEVDLSERDALFADAARVIVMHQQGSTSLIQRKLKLGYNRAGRLIDQLEAAGIVGGFEGSKAREVLIPDEYALEQLLNELESKS